MEPVTEKEVVIFKIEKTKGKLHVVLNHNDEMYSGFITKVGK